MSHHQAPSAGMKVTPKNPPTNQEATGRVEDTSLAAESVRAGGAFSANPNSHSFHQQTSSSTGTGAAPGSGDLKSSTSTGTGTNAAINPGVGGGPIGAQNASHISAGSGNVTEGGSKPHGKNLKEGGFEGSGTAEGAWAEPGTEGDPGRKGLEKIIGKGGGQQQQQEGERGRKVAGENMFSGLEESSA